MKKQTNTITALPFNLEEATHADLRQLLEKIELKLEQEIGAKQKTIDHQEKMIQRLHTLMDEKTNMIIELNNKLVECSRNSEGSRQLINKLLNDIDRLQQDIEWYKRTYVKRTLAGVLKQKLFGK